MWLLHKARQVGKGTLALTDNFPALSSPDFSFSITTTPRPPHLHNDTTAISSSLDINL